MGYSIKQTRTLMTQGALFNPSFDLEFRNKPKSLIITAKKLSSNC